MVVSDEADHFRALDRRFERTIEAVDHARDLINGSFEPVTTRTAESTNHLVPRLTFVTMVLGAVGALAGVLGMNFETPYFQTGPVGFWTVIALMGALIAGAIVLARRNDWV